MRHRQLATILEKLETFQTNILCNSSNSLLTSIASSFESSKAPETFCSKINWSNGFIFGVSIFGELTTFEEVVVLGVVSDTKVKPIKGLSSPVKLVVSSAVKTGSIKELSL
jgi:hypothetical protein